MEKEIEIILKDVKLNGILFVPKQTKGIVLFAHGSGSSWKCPRNKFMAEKIQKQNVATLLFDLLSIKEGNIDEMTKEIRFDIALLTKRLVEVTDWTQSQKGLASLSIGYFGSSTGAAAAIIAACERPTVKTVVSGGGRVDLAKDALTTILCPTLFIVGEDDLVVIDLNKIAYDRLKGEKKLSIIPRATHLFEEPGKLEQVADIASEWFKEKLS